MGKYTKTKSKYIFKKAHSLSVDGSIFEQDLLTNNELYDYSNGNMVIGVGDGFNVITNTQDIESKTYNNGSISETFVLNDFISELREEERVNNSINYTNIPLTHENTIGKTSVKINKNYFDLTKISYYGSCQGHIKSAIEDIILRFPASLYVKNQSSINTNTITIPLSNVSNPFFLDISNYDIYDRSTMNFDLRILATSYSAYIISDSNDLVYSNISGFTNDGNNLIFNLTGNININSDFHIKPNKKYVDSFFNSLNGIQVALLNRNSTPKFKSRFKTIEETEDGISYKYIEFTWKTYDEYNLDITSIDYLNFVDNLIQSSEYIDQKFSDNIYRMLTHDSIKSMDNSFVRQNRLYMHENIDEEDILDGESKIQKLLRIYGRYFDDIKEYIDGVTFINNISYDKKENINDVYLQNKLNYMGWNTPKLTNILPTTGETSANLYPGLGGRMTITDVENELNRRIIINSKNIFRGKGTKKSIRKVFGLLGIDDRIYDVREYSQDVTDYITGETLQKIKELNGDLRSNQFETSFIKNGLVDTDISLSGLNLKTFVKCPICGELDYTTNFNITNENLIDNSQSPSWSPNNQPITSILMTYEFEKFRRNTPTLGYALSIFSGGIGQYTFDDPNCTYYASADVRPQGVTGTFSNITIYIHTDYDDSIRVNTNIPNGVWTRVYTEGFTIPIADSLTSSGYVILYNDQIDKYLDVKNVKIEKDHMTPWSPSISDQELLEYGICVKNKHTFDVTGNTFAYPFARTNSSDYYFQQMGSWYRETGGVHTDLSGNTYVIDIMDGNNPHIGNGSYDYGTNYIDNFKQLFKTDIDSQLNYPTIDITGHTGYGFNLINKKTVDNNKIVWVVDGILTDDYGNNILTDNDEIIYVDYDNLNAKFKINLKNFVIGIDTQKALNVFTSGNTAYTGGLTEDTIFETIKKLALPYLENVIPSTTIFDFVRIDKNNPKWQLVEKYPERTGETQNYSGKTILRYKNVNYYDETTTGATQDLLDLIEKDFGDMFIQYGSVVGSGFDMEISFIGDNGEYERVTTADWQETDNLFNFLTT